MTAPVEIRALHALPMSSAAGRWLTPASLAVQIGIAPDVARSVLVGLRRRGLAEDDGSLPQAFARTTKGDWQLEQDERPREQRA